MRNGTPGFVPGRLVLAREAQGYVTREALARRVGKSASTVQRWEDGSATPEPDALRSLAEALNVRPEHFLRPLLQSDRPVFFRSLASTLKREKALQRARMSWLFDLSTALQEYIELPSVDIPDAMGRTSFKQLRNEDLERIALQLREHWGLGQGPCVDVVAFMERSGFVVASEEMGTSRLDGLCRWRDEEQRPYVLLADDKMSFSRRQMDSAHEMAHAVLHRGVSAIDFAENFELIEQQAFRLGSAFLLPGTTYPNETRFHSLAEFEALKDRWKVSIKAQIKRLSDLNILDPESARALYKSYSARGWSRGEPFDDVWPVPRPRALAEGFNAVVDAQLRTKIDLLNSDLTISARDAESLAGLPLGWFDEKQGGIVKLIPRSEVARLPQTKAGDVLPFRFEGR
ncbi:MAG: helix-turn-helix domain-containing protein [Alphaproteobacteria bacterium]|nr:helix-turn-helix domain-containing protein [Alphaproteobacteria bacterium]